MMEMIKKKICEVLFKASLMSSFELLTNSAIFFLSASLDSVGGDEDLTVLSFA
jgi:hypothetical protein